MDIHFDRNSFCKFCILQLWIAKVTTNYKTVSSIHWNIFQRWSGVIQQFWWENLGDTLQHQLKLAEWKVDSCYLLLNHTEYINKYLSWPILQVLVYWLERNKGMFNLTRQLYQIHLPGQWQLNVALFQFLKGQ